MFDREKYVSRGRDVLGESLWSAWEIEVDHYADDVYGGVDLMNALDVIESLNRVNFREAFLKLSRQDHNVETYSNVLRLVYTFATNGTEFHNYMKRV